MHFPCRHLLEGSPDLHPKAERGALPLRLRSHVCTCAWPHRCAHCTCYCGVFILRPTRNYGSLGMTKMSYSSSQPRRRLQGRTWPSQLVALWTPPIKGRRQGGGDTDTAGCSQTTTSSPPLPPDPLKIQKPLLAPGSLKNRPWATLCL